MAPCESPAGLTSAQAGPGGPPRGGRSVRDLGAGWAGGTGCTTVESQGLWSDREGRRPGPATHRLSLSNAQKLSGPGAALCVEGSNRVPSRGCRVSVRWSLAWRKGLEQGVHSAPSIQPVRGPGGSHTQFNGEGKGPQLGARGLVSIMTFFVSGGGLQTRLWLHPLPSHLKRPHQAS